jgi:hypothetical protein
MTDIDDSEAADADIGDDFEDSDSDGVEAVPNSGRDTGDDSYSIAARERLRNEMANDVEAFLRRGGKISYIDANVTADPPQRPENHYGERPI